MLLYLAVIMRPAIEFPSQVDAQNCLLLSCGFVYFVAAET